MPSSLQLTIGSLEFGEAGGRNGNIWLIQVTPPSVDVYIQICLVLDPERSSLAADTTFNALVGLIAMLGSCWARLGDCVSVFALKFAPKLGISSGLNADAGPVRGAGPCEGGPDSRRTPVPCCNGV